MPEKRATFQVDDAVLLPPPFKNFSGKKTMYNNEGARNFCIVLDPEFAAVLANDGWAVKQLDPREEGEVGDFYIKITVKYGDYPPRITTISSAGRTILDKDTVDILDSIRMAKVDLICNAFDWGPMADGKSGRSAYLQTMYVTIDEDPLEARYNLLEKQEKEERLRMAEKMAERIPSD